MCLSDLRAHVGCGCVDWEPLRLCTASALGPRALQGGTESSFQKSSAAQLEVKGWLQTAWVIVLDLLLVS